MPTKFAWWEILGIVGFIILVVVRMAHVGTELWLDLFPLIVYALLIYLAFYLVYWIIRLAVRHGMKDCVNDHRNEQHVK